MSNATKDIFLEELFLTNNTEYLYACKGNIHWVPGKTSNNAIIWCSEKLGSYVIIIRIFEDHPGSLDLFRESIIHLWDKLDDNTRGYAERDTWISYKLGTWGLIPQRHNSQILDWLESGQTTICQKLDTKDIVIIRNLPSQQRYMVYNGILEGGIMQHYLSNFVYWFIIKKSINYLPKLLAVQPICSIAAQLDFIRSTFKYELEKLVDMEKHVAEYASTPDANLDRIIILIKNYKKPNWDMTSAIWQNAKIPAEILQLDYSPWNRNTPAEVEKWDTLPIEHLFKYTFERYVPKEYIEHLVDNRLSTRFASLDRYYPNIKQLVTPTLDTYIWICQTVGGWFWHKDMAEEFAEWCLEHYSNHRYGILVYIFSKWGFNKFVEFYQLYPITEIAKDDFVEASAIDIGIANYISGDARLLKYIHLINIKNYEEIEIHTRDWLPEVRYCLMGRLIWPKELKKVIVSRYLESRYESQFRMEYPGACQMVE